jgi:hypothetical protein
MRKILLFLLAGTLVFGIWRTWAGDETPPSEFKPVAVISFTGLDGLKKDLALAGKLADDPKLNDQVEWWLNLVYQNLQLIGFDGTRPWGAVVQTDGDKMSGFAFLPFTDLAQLGKVAEPFIGKPEDTGDGIYKISHKHKPVFVTQKNSWTFVAHDRQSLTHIPDDPVALLDGLNKQYDVALRIHMANIPEKYPEKILRKLKHQIAEEAKNRHDEPEPVHLLRAKLADYVQDCITRLTKDVDDITLGWKLDTEAPKTYLELSVTAKQGTPLAQALSSWSETKSDFTGFRRPDAAFFANCAGKLPQQKIEILDMFLNALHDQAISDIERNEKNQEQARLAKQMVDKLAELLHETVQSGRIDNGCAVLLEPKALTVLAGAYVSNNGRLEEIAQTIVDVLKKANPAFGQMVHLNAEEYQGVNFHTLSIPIPTEGMGERKKLVLSLVGETLQIVVGTSPKSIYLAFGREPMKNLKEAIDRSLSKPSPDLPPAELSISLDAIAQFAAATGKAPQRQAAAIVAEELKKAAPQDHLSFTVMPIAQGVKYRLEVQEGVLKSLGKLIELKLKTKRHLAQQSTFFPAIVKELTNTRSSEDKILVNAR